MLIKTYQSRVFAAWRWTRHGNESARVVAENTAEGEIEIPGQCFWWLRAPEAGEHDKEQDRTALSRDIAREKTG